MPSGHFASDDLAGQSFGLLTALRLTGRRTANRSAIWLCACRCGNEVERTRNQLTRLIPGAQSCGCVPSHRRDRLPKKKYGKWLVLRRDPERLSQWICRCRCGAERSVRQQMLLSDRSRSCGAKGCREVR